MKQKLIRSAMMALGLMVLLSVSAFAENYYIDEGNITVTADGTGQKVVQNGTSTPDSAPVITQRNSSTATNNTITITAASGAEAKVTLGGVNIDVSASGSVSAGIDGNAAVSVEGDGDVTIELDHDNILKSGYWRAGMEKNSTGLLTITDTDNNGSVTATGGEDGAGIGGGINKKTGSNITISGGSVTATGGHDGAGIGGGSDGTGSDITISGGSVTATGGANGAGIGGGLDATGSDITISGGSVTATSDYNGAGIGGGSEGTGSNITISGGDVTAIGAYAGAGIGGGKNKKTGSENITVSGDAHVTVQGSLDGFEDKAALGAGIGNGGTVEFEGAGAEVIICTNGSEVAPDCSNLTQEGYILYYAAGADMKTAVPTHVIHYGNTTRHEGTLTITPATAATCTTAGNTFGLSCSCGTINLASESIEAGHDWDVPTYDWATDYSTCTATRSCKRDASHSDTITVTASAQVTQEQTCTTDELTTYTAVFPTGFETQTKENIKTADKWAVCPASNYRDVDVTQWYHVQVDYVIKSELMIGDGNGYFRPDDSLSRAEMVQILYAWAGSPEVTGTSAYTDVLDSAWYAKAVIWATEKNVVYGVGNNQFKPNQEITRQDVVAMLYRYAGSPKTTGTLDDFTDAETVSDYAEDAMCWAIEADIVHGDGTPRVLRPKDNVTRAEIATLLYLYIG